MRRAQAQGIGLAGEEGIQAADLFEIVAIPFEDAGNRQAVALPAIAAAVGEEQAGGVGQLRIEPDRADCGPISLQQPGGGERAVPWAARFPRL